VLTDVKHTLTTSCQSVMVAHATTWRTDRRFASVATVKRHAASKTWHHARTSAHADGNDCCKMRQTAGTAGWFGSRQVSQIKTPVACSMSAAASFRKVFAHEQTGSKT
jgi:hypothetical protein